MKSDPMPIIVVADRRSARVNGAWDDFEKQLRARREVTVTGVADGSEPDFRSVTADLAVVLGGDGSILRACRKMGSQQLPILGVNLGRLGFLADLSLPEFFDYLPLLSDRTFHVVHYLMFECLLTYRDGRTETHLGLNEVAVSSGGALRMIDVRLAINGEPVTTYSGDGVIVSTPVGSTAHNLSAGGPILRQDLQAFVITPICPHTLTVRPLIDSADVTYTLTVPEAPEGTTLVIDGQIRRPIAPGDRIDIRKAPVSLKMAKVPHSSHYATLYRKLGWGGQTQARAT